MEPIKNLFGKKYRQNPSRAEKKKRDVERGKLFEFFVQTLNSERKKGLHQPFTYARMGYHLEGIPTKDLYALESKMKDAQRRGFPASVVFWQEIRSDNFAQRKGKRKA